jgi:hypothetical protein
MRGEKKGEGKTSTANEVFLADLPIALGLLVVFSLIASPG